MNIVVSDYWNVGIFKCFYCIWYCSNLRYIVIGYDMGSINWIRINIYFNSIYVGIGKCFCVIVCCNVICNNLYI